MISRILFVAAGVSAADDYTIVLHPPEMSAAAQNDAVDAAVGGSFVENPAADFSISLRGSDVSAADAKAAIASISRAENAKAATAAEEFAADKKLILQSVRQSFLEPLAPLGVQDVRQAALPLEVNVNFDAPKSFIAGDAMPSEQPRLNVHIDASFAETVHEFAQENLNKLSALNQELTSFAQVNAAPANACNYGRLATQAAYALANVESHILNALTAASCGCVYIGTFGNCILSKAAPAYPICEAINNVRENAFAESVSIWESVKAKTKSCNQNSMLGLPRLNLHVGETPRSFLSSEFGSLVNKVRVGGLTAGKALAAILEQIGDENEQKAAISAGVLTAAKDLMARESSSNQLRNLAGSVASTLSRSPAISEVSDDDGSSGEVTIVMPRPSAIYP